MIQRTYLPVPLIPELKDSTILGYDQPRLKSANFSKESKTHVVWNCRFHPDANCLGSNVCKGFSSRKELRKEKTFVSLCDYIGHPQNIVSDNETPSFAISKLLSRSHCSLVAEMPKSKSLETWQASPCLVTTGTDMKILSLNAKLVGMYASCGDLGSARFIFERIQKPNGLAVNWMVLASAFNGYFEEAIGYFSVMRGSMNFCNKFTFPVLLKACVGLMDLNKGKEVHAIVKMTGLESEVGNPLIDMYGKCRHLCYARKVFDRMVERDIVSWTSMICGYCNVGNMDIAFDLLQRMKLEGLSPNDFTWNALVSGYARVGDIRGAVALFDRMIGEGLVPDLITWNAIISGYHNRIAPSLWIDWINSKSVKDAENVLEKMPIKNSASWNALIGCYGKHGMIDSAIMLFERMQEEGIQASGLTLTSVLSACSHSGSVEKGRMEKAYELIKEMPFEVTESIACAFFHGCKIHGRQDLAKLMGEKILKMELRKPGGFVTLSNIFAADGEWEEVENLRKIMKEKRIQKVPGFSWLEKKDDLAGPKVEEESNRKRGDTY
ncbi:hypothetical protein SLEP1_g58871 [Rubroshorea leprosula]|uniref:Pentatricopeptide repeat-containing protein n=1 Tax=Rubroshorea leprosula TaxID=152421 RepID=A0AAV5MQP2_9ROSI|nr:hypothetical protein SLEP1_g58871 [Rubroshorea leprosula]